MNVLSVLDWFETQSLKQRGCRLEVNGLQSCGGVGVPMGSQRGVAGLIWAQLPRVLGTVTG